MSEAQGRGGRDLLAVGQQVRTKVYLTASDPSPTACGEPQAVSDGIKIHLSDPGADAPADGRSMKKTNRTLRLLLSFFYYRDEDVVKLLKDCFEGIELDCFADSGAYSAKTQNQVIDEAEYMAWVERWKTCFSAAAGPDVIGNPEESFAATQRMRERVTGIPVLPVFHVGEDWVWLDRILSTGADYIALGGMVPYTKDRKFLTAWLTRAFSVISTTVRVHGFGLTTWPLLMRFPWYSVDSSSWTAGFRFASLALFDERRGRFETVDMRSKKDLLKHGGLMARYGLRSRDAQAASYDRDLLCGVCVESWQRAEEWLSQHKIYLSCGAYSQSPGGGHARADGSGMRAYLTSSSSSAGANNSPQAIQRGLKTYLSAGSAPIEGAPNRPEGLARPVRAYEARSNTKVNLSVGAGPGAGNHPMEVGRALRKGVDE